MTSLDPNRLLQAYTRIAELEVELEQAEHRIKDLQSELDDANWLRSQSDKKWRDLNHD